MGGRGFAVWALALIAVSMLPVTPAAAANALDPMSSEGTSGSQTLTYLVNRTGTLTDIPGEGDPAYPYTPGTNTLTFACEGSICLLTDVQPRDETIFNLWSTTPIDVTAGEATASTVGDTDSCEGNAPTATGTLTLTNTSLSGTYSQQPIANTSGCEGGGYYGAEVQLSGRLTDGPSCVFDPGGCGITEQTESPTSGTDSAGSAQTGSANFTESELATGAAAAPSVLSALPTPANAGTAPTQLAVSALLTVILVLLVAFPTALLNSAVETATDRFSGWREARRSRRDSGVASTDSQSPSRRGKWWWATLGVLAASVISAFIDPQFGVNAGSARVLLSILLSLIIDVLIGWFLVIWLVRRSAPEATHSFAFKPATLLIVVAAVVFTRVTGFEPGIVFGLVAGVAFATMRGRRQRAMTVLTTLGYAFAVGFLAWLLYGVMGGGATSGGSWEATFAVETLSSIAIAGMAAIPIALFPVRGMPGHTVWTWSRGVWGGCYAVGLFAFFVVLMPMPFSWAGVAMDLGAWVLFYLLYALGATIAWAALSRPWQRATVGSDLQDS